MRKLKVNHCVNHPDRETSYECLKHKIFMCQDCIDCRDPEIYCKFRESCTIWFLTKKNFDDAMKKVLPSISKKEVDAYKKIEENYLKSAKAAIDNGAGYLG